MYCIALSWLGVSLELAPRWGESAGLLQVAPWLLLSLIPVALVLWLYGYEMQLVSRLVAGGLLLLRLLVIALLLFLIVLQPRLVPSAQQPGDPRFADQRLMVVLDRSGSMDVKDPQRPPLEKLRLALALHLASDICPNLQLEEWIRAYQQHGQPRWLADGELADDPEARARLEKERKRIHDQVCQRVDGKTRTEIARALLDDQGGRLLSRLGEKFKLDLVGFARDSVAFPGGKLDDLAAWPAAAKLGVRQATNLTLPLERALKEAGRQRGRLRGVVLLTDGRHNRGEQPLDLADRLGQAGVPIYPVPIGSPQGRSMLAIISVEAPEVVLKDPDNSETVNCVVQAILRVRGVARQTLVLELTGADGKLYHRLRLPHDGSTRDYRLNFPIVLDREGVEKLSLAVAPVAGVEDQADRPPAVEVGVVRDQAEVLMIDGEARWEYHYIAVALGRDRLVKEVTGVVFDQPRLEKNPKRKTRLPGLPDLALPEGEHALADYDIVILGDPDPKQLLEADQNRLARFVKDCGGTLVIVAGKRFMPLGYPATGVLPDLLPIEEPRVVRSTQGFPIALTGAGRATPLLRLEDAGEAGTDLWSELPPHYWGVIGKRKSAATTLAYYPGEGDPARAKTPAEQDDSALIAWHTVGKGRVLFIGVDSTWRWRYKVGDRYHHRFWGQLVRWAIQDKLLPSGTQAVRFGTSRRTFAPGEDVPVQVRLAKEIKPLEPGAHAQARILRSAGGKDETVAVVPLAPRPGQPHVLDAPVRDLAPGQYQIELDIPSLADKLQDSQDPLKRKVPRSGFQVAPSPSAEMLDTSSDLKLLQALADRTGAGVLHPPEEAGQLVEQISRQQERGDPRGPQPLWEWWPTLVLLLVLLTLEWVVRKRAGLP
jgi:hypothetical protein